MQVSESSAWTLCSVLLNTQKSLCPQGAHSLKDRSAKKTLIARDGSGDNGILMWVIVHVPHRRSVTPPQTRTPTVIEICHRSRVSMKRWDVQTVYTQHTTFYIHFQSFISKLNFLLTRQIRNSSATKFEIFQQSWGGVFRPPTTTKI